MASAANEKLAEVDRNKRLYQKLKDILRDEVKLDDNEKKRNKDILKKVVEEGLMKKMCEIDKLFKLLYKGIYYTGSYYEGLRVKSADEFDLNIILELPIKKEDRKIITDGKNVPKSFCFLKLMHTLSSILEKHRDWPTYRSMEKFFDPRTNLLNPVKIRCWMQSLVDQALPNLGKIPGVNKIVPSQHGPAKTIYIYTDDNRKIDVDLVPVFKMKWPEWPQGARTKFLSGISENSRIWFLVPKPFKGKQNPENHELLWRLHFPEVEKSLMHHKGCVKPIIKLLKLLRDREGWHALASYYLKTVVLWQIEKRPKPDDWKEDKMAELFIVMLEKIQEYMKSGVLPYFIYPQYSLIEGIGAAEKDNIYQRIQRILKKINTNPEQIVDIIVHKK